MSTITTKSKKAARIESALLNKLALMGQKTFARTMGALEYQVSRWKNGFFSQVSMMLAVLEYGIEDDGTAELTKRLADYLTKEKAPKNGGFFGVWLQKDWIDPQESLRQNNPVPIRTKFTNTCYVIASCPASSSLVDSGLSRKK